jgi:hypothetical protein|tara:strand:+ start:4771 stop:5043 length:273 start_codon:yes stop_codon:yes gene_type:complete
MSFLKITLAICCSLILLGGALGLSRRLYHELTYIHEQAVKMDILTTSLEKVDGGQNKVLKDTLVRQRTLLEWYRVVEGRLNHLEAKCGEK